MVSEVWGAPSGVHTTPYRGLPGWEQHVVSFPRLRLELAVKMLKARPLLPRPVPSRGPCVGRRLSSECICLGPIMGNKNRPISICLLSGQVSQT